MKLAFCLFNYFPFGGLQRDCLHIAKECVRRGHSVDVLTMRWDGEKDPDLNIIVMPSSRWQNHTQAQQFVKKCEERKKHHAYDRIIGFNKMPGLDVYYAADTCFQAKINKKHPHFFYHLLPRYRHLLQYETAVFSHDSKTDILLISPLQQAEFAHYYNTPKARFHLLPPGIERNRIATENAKYIRAHTRQELGMSENEFLLLMVGSGFKTKGLDRILLGMAALPEKNSRLFVAGQDNATPFKKQATELGIADRVYFLGGRNDIPRLLLAADLLVHPAYNENTGTVLLEAVVSGLPVLTTDVCGYAHYITESQTGLVLSSPFQQKLFNQSLQNMLLSPERDTWHANGLAFAKWADIYDMPKHAVDMIESGPQSLLR